MSSDIRKMMNNIKKVNNQLNEDLNKSNNYSNEIVAYHGTINKGYSSYGYTYYTSDYDYAKKYAEGKGEVKKVVIGYNKPFLINAKYMGYGEIVFKNKIIGFYRNLKSDAVIKLQSSGYDIIIVNYPEKNINAFEIIPFNKDQVTLLEVLDQSSNKGINDGVLVSPTGDHEEAIYAPLRYSIDIKL